MHWRYTAIPADAATALEQRLEVSPILAELLLRVNNITGGYSFYFSIAGIARHAQQGER